MPSEKVKLVRVEKQRTWPRRRSVGLTSCTVAGLLVAGTMLTAAGCGGDEFVLDPCSGRKGAPMVAVTDLDGGVYCIDKTEVSGQLYLDFLDDIGPDPIDQPGICAFNRRAEGQMVDPLVPERQDWPGGGSLGQPVVQVDWCDARAYCKWAGKRMCGAFSGKTLMPNVFPAIPPADVGGRTSLAERSEWYNACSDGGTKGYPYGDKYKAMACNGFDRDPEEPIEANTPKTCEGGVAGLLGMSGNAREWQNVCDGEAEDSNCVIIGGGYSDMAEGLFCESTIAGARVTKRFDIGFRCCADAISE